MTTKSAKKGGFDQKWFLVDADDQVLGRLSSRIATILRGKHKAEYTPHVDTGDFVIVINAEKVKVTGKKETDKVYERHTGWAGGIVTETVATVRKDHPDRLIKKAVWGMLPKGPLGRRMFSKLKVYAGGEHPHAAQSPESLSF